MLALRALGWLFGLFGLFLLATFGLSFGFMDDPPLWVKGVGALGGVLVASFFALNWSTLRALGREQTFTRMLTAVFAGFLALGIVITANVVAHRYDERWDITETKRYTLSQQSTEVAKQLDREIEVIAFLQGGSPDDQNFRELMRRYQEHTTLLKVEYYDALANPTVADQYEVRTDAPVVVLKVGDNTQRLDTALDEEAFTNALVRATSDVQHSVCVISGHGERELMDDQTGDGLGIAKQKLEGVNYKVSTISLLQAPPSPATCEVVVLPSPQVDLLVAERDRLAEYVAAGGGLVVFIDPMHAAETAADLARYGVKVGADLVIEADPYRQTQQGPTSVVLDDTSFDVHPITAKLKGGGLFAQVRSVGKGDEVPGLNVQVLAMASEQSWAESALTESPDTWEPTPGLDLVSKVPLAAAVEVTDPAAIRTRTELPVAALGEGAPVAPVVPVEPAAALPPKAGGKVVIYGDGDFASNKDITIGVNQDIFLNAVAWIVGEDDQISIRPNEAGKGKLSFDLLSGFLTVVLVMIVAPGLAITAAVGTWLRRRRL